jgi:hypothetical protein
MWSNCLTWQSLVVWGTCIVGCITNFVRLTIDYQYYHEVMNHFVYVRPVVHLFSFTEPLQPSDSPGVRGPQVDKHRVCEIFFHNLI